MPTPGTIGDDVRWTASRAELLRLGAFAVAVRHMDELLGQTHPVGHPILITANDAGAASCWLRFDIETSNDVGSERLTATKPSLWPWPVCARNSANRDGLAALIRRPYD